MSEASHVLEELEMLIERLEVAGVIEPLEPNGTQTKGGEVVKNNTKLKPLLDRVIVDVDKAPEPKGIVLPGDTKLERPPRGMVVAVGEGYRTPDGKRYPLDVKVGDRVELDRGRGKPIMYGGIEMLIVHEGEILAVEK